MKIFLILLFLPVMAVSQTEWTLQQCIDSAIVNNSDVRLAELTIFVADQNLKASKWNFLPTAGVSASHGYNWGQTIDPFTNQFATNRVQTNNFYLSSSVLLFSGLSNYYSTKMTRIDQEIATITKEYKQRDITIDVLSGFFQAKLNQEIVQLREKHLEISEKQMEKAKLLESMEYNTRQKVLEAEAQYSSDSYQLLLATNDWKKSLFLMQIILGRAADSTFSIANDDFSLKSSFAIDETELALLEQKRKLMEMRKTSAQFYPSISLNGSLGSGYSGNNLFLDQNNVLVPKSFRTQLDENFYQSVSATISIPIFSGVNAYSQLKVKKLEADQLKIETEETLRQLENKRLGYQLDVENQRLRVASAEASLISYRALFEGAKFQFEEGVIDFYTFLQAKDTFFKAESELIQAKFELEFRSAILDLFR